jgi:hypothetical protein
MSAWDRLKEAVKAIIWIELVVIYMAVKSVWAAVKWLWDRLKGFVGVFKPARVAVKPPALARNAHAISSPTQPTSPTSVVPRSYQAMTTAWVALQEKARRVPQSPLQNSAALILNALTLFVYATVFSALMVAMAPSGSLRQLRRYRRRIDQAADATTGDARNPT